MTSGLMSYEEYLASSFESKREWVDECASEVTGGEFTHSLALACVAAEYHQACEDTEFVPLIRVRIRTCGRCVRIPDLTVVRSGDSRETPITRPPLLVTEIRSDGDSHRALASRAEEFYAFGIEHVWVIDPYARVAYRGTANGLELVRSGELAISGTPIRVVPAEIFAELDAV